MAYFRYKLIEPTGKITSGMVNLPYEDETSASFHLERDEGTLVYVKKIGSTASYLIEKLTSLTRRKLTRTLQAEFLSNMAMMMRSGMTLTTAMEEAASGIEVGGFMHDISYMILRIEGGATFSEVAERYNYIFPATITHLLRMGEETGKLDQMLMDAAEHLRRIDSIISDTKQALLYPSMVFIALGAGIVFWFYYVVPKIVGLFEEMDVTLPAITRFLLQISLFVQHYIVLLLLILSAAVILFSVAYQRNRKVRWAVDSILLRVPVTGTIISASNLAFISEYFSLLLNAGIDIVNTITILRDSIRNEVYRQKLGVVLNGLRRSESIADSFRNAVVFPSFVVRMINVGELSGTLDTQLAHIASNYRNKLSVLVATIGKLIEPVVLVVAGVIFAIILIGLFLPIYDMLGRISIG